MRPVFLLLFILCINVHAQTVFSFDFGSSALAHGTSGPVNNIARSINAGTINETRLISTNGLQTDLILKMTDDFRSTNTTGALQASHDLAYKSNQTNDSFWGNTQSFSGSINNTGGFELRGLDHTKLYSIQIFASRMNVNDIRETQYNVTGQQSHNQLLNASNNTTQTADFYNLIPNSQGVISISATAGPNNTSSGGFFYINAMTVIEHDTLLSSFTKPDALELIYPISTAVWESGKPIQIQWESNGIQNITIEESNDNGTSWYTLATVPAVKGHYDYTAPTTTGTYLYRISGNTLSDQSTTVQIIPNDGIFYNIHILGSSTAAGTGPSHPINTWVNKYKRALYELDTRYQIENLAIGGQVTYNLLPTGSTIPSGVSHTVNPNANITAAITAQTNAVIINLPSNDASNGYPVNDQINNYTQIINNATTVGIPVWQTTPQPRYFGSNTTALSIQQAMLTATWQHFPNTTIDFWSGLPVAGDNGLLPQYDSGDGVHANNAAHHIFYERMFTSGIHNDVKQQVDAILNLADNSPTIPGIYPNPVVDYLYLNGINGQVHYYIYETSGRLIQQGISSNSIYLGDLSKGIYVIQIDNNSHLFIKD